MSKNTISSFFSPKQVLCQTTIGQRDALLLELLKLALKRMPEIDCASAYQALLEREHILSSALEHGLAIPHVRLEQASSLTMAIATSKTGIDFHGKAGKIHLAVLIVTPKADPDAYLHVLSCLTKALPDRKTIDYVAALPDAKSVWQFFERGGAALPHRLSVSHIMNSRFVALKDTDTLGDAIDAFVKHRLPELPVIDKDGDLVGVVTIDRLLKLCLPEHVLWMEDLSAIVNFDSFSEVLLNEDKTWLSDIMTTEYVTLPLDAPAAMAAKQMAMRGLPQVLVVEGKRLVGVISGQDFIASIFRR